MKYKIPKNHVIHVGDKVCMYSSRIPDVVRKKTWNTLSPAIGLVTKILYDGVEVELFNPPICK